MTTPADFLNDARRLVIKVGSALLVNTDTGRPRQEWLAALCAELARYRAKGVEVVIVSSGAIAMGRFHLNLRREGLKLPEKQAAAATGQVLLARAWQDALAPHGLTLSQVLLILDDTEERRRHLNARNTLHTLLSLGTIPVINENDTVGTSEIRFGDNDRLAARVAVMIDADLLVLLSDIDGLYSADPGKNPDARFIPVIPELTPDIEAMAGQAASGLSTGGMVTKLAAARIAVSAGTHMIIADGRKNSPLRSVEEQGRASVFVAGIEPGTARKRYIAGTLKPSGALYLDSGAIAALKAGKSLLPVGVTQITGDFLRGDAIRLLTPDGQEIARGISAYDKSDARQIIGHRSDEIALILGYDGRDEIIHRDDLVLL